MTENEIKLDLERRARLGFDEAIFCAGKSTEQLVGIFEIGRASCRERV